MLRHISPALSVAILTVVIFSLTKLNLTSPFRLQMALLCIIVTIFYFMVFSKRVPEQSKAGFSAYLLSATTLFIVGATGWFFSPFFFSLYLLAVLYSFIFTPATSMAFVAILVTLFSFNIGEVDVAYDFLVILSLLTTIPICLYLRREYLKLREYEKKILILETEQKNFQDVVEKVLANKIIKFAADLKQPVNDTKQLAYELKVLKNKKDIEKVQERIIEAADEAINELKRFEEAVTGSKLITHLTDPTKDTSSPSQPTEAESDQSLSEKPSPLNLKPH